MTSLSSWRARVADEPVSGRKVVTRAAKALVMVLSWVMIGAALFVVAPGGQAVVLNNLFELGPGIPSDEGGLTDILGDGLASDGPDWGIIPGDVPDGIFDGSGDVVFPGAIAQFLKDDLSQSSSVDQTTYSGAGGSNKNGDPITDWHWATGNVPAKDDLSNAYAYATMDEDHLIIYAGFERIASNGDSHIDIEFFKDNVRLNQSVPCTSARCDWLGSRTVGDIIISMDFLKGGEFGTMTVREWDGTAYALVASLGSEGCNADGTICGYNNGGPISSGPWPSYDSHGHEITTLPHNAFTEFGVDVTALENGVTPCLTTVLGKTRSSQSFTAELKDFAGPSGFPICGANIAIGPSAVNEVGTPHTFTVWVNQSFGGIPSPAVDDTLVTVDLSEEFGASVDLVADNCADPGTVDGVCTVTFKSDTAGTVTGHASASVVVGTDTIKVETDGVGGNSGNATKRYVDAKISIAPGATNRVGQNHEFTVTVKMDAGDEAGWVNATDGTYVTVTLTPSDGATIEDVDDECGVPGLSDGTCTVTFTSSTPGKVTGHANVSFELDGVTLERETDGVAPNSGDAVKVFVDAKISISPDKVNEVGDTHTFVVTAKINAGDGNGWVNPTDGTPVTVTLTATNGSVVSDKTDTCASPGLSSGTCSVSFTSLIAGTVTGHASADLAVGGLTISVATDGTGQNGVNATKRFVDAYITITPAEDTNSIEESHTLTVSVKMDAGDEAGWVDAPDGTYVTVTLTPSDGATIEDVDDECGVPGLSDGTCTVTFTSSTAGTVTAHANVSFELDGVTLDRETDGVAPNSGNATKVFVAGSIAWTKVDNADRKQGGATFEVCRIADWDSDSEAFVTLASAVCFDVTDNVAPDADPDDGEFLVENLVLGRYTVHETIAPPGYVPDPKTETVDLSLSNPDAVIEDPFVNERPILKLTSFGYTNTPTGTPNDGVVSGTTVYSFSIENFGDADALVNLTFVLSVTGASSGTVTYGGSTGPTPESEPGEDGNCIPGCTVEWVNVSIAAHASEAFTVTIVYDDVTGGTQIRADLAATYTVDPPEGFDRNVSGAPAAIIFTVQDD